MDNNELISAIRNSSERAFQIVFNKYYLGLVRFACSYTENSDAAENIVQDSFVVLWEKREILEEDSNLHALLVQIVKLKVWNYIEKQRRRVLVEKSLYDNAVREMNLKLYTLDSINTTSLYIEDIKKIIEETLTELPELTQKIFRMSREEYLSNKEIAQRVNLSEKSIEFHISKAIKQLRLSLSPYLRFLLFF